MQDKVNETDTNEWAEPDLEPVTLRTTQARCRLHNRLTHEIPQNVH